MSTAAFVAGAALLATLCAAAPYTLVNQTVRGSLTVPGGHSSYLISGSTIVGSLNMSAVPPSVSVTIEHTTIDASKEPSFSGVTLSGLTDVTLTINTVHLVGPTITAARGILNISGFEITAAVDSRVTITDLNLRHAIMGLRISDGRGNNVTVRRMNVSDSEMYMGCGLVVYNVNASHVALSDSNLTGSDNGLCVSESMDVHVHATDVNAGGYWVGVKLDDVSDSSFRFKGGRVNAGSEGVNLLHLKNTSFVLDGVDARCDSKYDSAPVAVRVKESSSRTVVAIMRSVLKGNVGVQTVSLVDTTVQVMDSTVDGLVAFDVTGDVPSFFFLVVNTTVHGLCTPSVERLCEDGTVPPTTAPTTPGATPAGGTPPGQKNDWSLWAFIGLATLAGIVLVTVIVTVVLRRRLARTEELAPLNP
jgi:hypothetical protein